MATKKALANEADSIANKLEALKEAMREFFDDKSETWQNSDDGDTWCSFQERVESAQSEMEDVAAFLRGELS